jgi:Flp pilus assembly pilin Flp
MAWRLRIQTLQTRTPAVCGLPDEFASTTDLRRETAERRVIPPIEWSQLMLALQLFYLKNRFLNEEAQDLVEYALVVAIISFCAVAAMKDLATGIASAFGTLATSFDADL